MSINQFLLSGDTTDLNYPEIRPSLDLNFARTKTLDPRITFTRASGGSYVGTDGFIKYAGVNEARFDHDPETGESLGLLIEEARTNLLLRSEEFDNASWVKSRSSISNNVDVAPRGSITADKLIEDTSVSLTHLVRADVTVTANTIYTVSVYVKSAERSRIRLDWSDASTSTDTVFGVFNLDTGVVTTSGVGGNASLTSTSIQSVGNGWYRCILTGKFNTTDTDGRVLLYLDNGTTITYTGDGTSGIYIWGAQLEVGSFPTSYIPTQGSTRTRAADNASITGKNFSSFYRQDEGSIYGDAIPFASGSLDNSGLTRGVATFSDGTTLERIRFGATPFGTIGATWVSRGVNQVILSTTVLEVKKRFKLVAAYKPEDFVLFRDGGSFLSSSDSFPLPTVNRLIIGRSSDTFGFLNGHISRLTYYPKRLTNSQLQALTR
jgi:hypothetical protein